MLTIDDLRNPKRQSGFDHVQGDPKHGGNKPYQGIIRGVTHKPAPWVGPRRETAEEAAQDYCDYMNAPKAPITIEDIRNPKRKSGFDHVHRAGGENGDSRRPSTQPWMTRIQRKRADGRPGSDTIWRGPRRATAEEAAQDYCDYINAQRVAPTASLKSAGHTLAPRKVRHPKLIEADRLRREALDEIEKDPSGYVYLIREKGSRDAVKVGESSDEPQYRLNGLQTGNPRVLEVLAFFHCADRKAAEGALHAKYIKDNILGEWFKPSRELLAEFGLPWYALTGVGATTGRFSCAQPNLSQPRKATA